MNNISEIQPRAFHRLHLLSELWVHNHSTHAHLMNLHCHNSCITRTSNSLNCWYPQTPAMRLMILARLWSPLPRKCLKQYASISWDGCTKGRAEANLIFTQRSNIWSLKRRFCARHPSLCFLALLEFGSAGQISRNSSLVDKCPRQDKHTRWETFRIALGQQIMQIELSMDSLEYLSHTSLGW